MVKKVVCIGLLLVFAFSITGCNKNNVNLDEYKANAIKELDDYANNLYYSSALFGDLHPYKNYLNGPGLDEIVADGKTLIESAFDKKDTTKMLSSAKNAIDTIPVGWIHSGAFSFGGFSFYLNYFDDDCVFECYTDEGEWDTAKETEKNLIIKTNDDMEDSATGTLTVVCLFFEANPSEQIFVDIVLKVNGLVIGYAIIEVYLFSYTETQSSYAARLLNFIVNTKVNDSYLPMDENEVKTAIETIKEKYKREEI